MNISDTDLSEFSLYTNTAHNIKEAKKHIISKRREINHQNFENGDLKQIQSTDDENNDSGEDVEKNKAQSDDACVVIEDSEVTAQQNSRPRRQPKRNKVNIVVDNSCVPSSSTAGQKRRTSKRKKANTVIVLDEDYPEPQSSVWIGTQRKKLSEDSVIIVDSAENSLDLVNISEVYDDENENEEITIVVKWKQMDVHKFQIRRFQDVSSIFEFFANKENIATEEIVLLRNDREIQQSDSPDSLGLKCIAMLDGDIRINRIIYGESTKPTQDEEKIIDVEEECLTVKVQAKHLKQPIEMTIKRKQKMNILIIKCCEKFNCPQNKLTLKFDGEILSLKDTADDLGLEGGECFDAYIH